MESQEEIDKWRIALRLLKEWAENNKPLEEKNEFTRGFNCGIKHAKENVMSYIKDLDSIMNAPDLDTLLKETDDLIEKWDKDL